MSNYHKTLRSIYLITVFSFMSKILGFVRELLIAAKFGSSYSSDSFFFAFTILSIFVTLSVRLFNITLIPILSDTLNNKKDKNNIVNNYLTIFMLASIFIILLLWFILPRIIDISYLGFRTEQIDLTLYLIKVGLPVISLSVLLGIFRGYLQSEDKFNESALTNIPYNLIYIFYLFFFSRRYGIKGLMHANVFAILSQVLLQIPAIHKLRFHYKPTIILKDSSFKKLKFLALPVMVSAIVCDVNLLIDRVMASNLAEGSISSLNYASRIDSLVVETFTLAIATVLFPSLSRHALTENKEEFHKLINLGINATNFIILPVTVAMIILAEPIVIILFYRGEFDVNSIKLTTGALLFYSIGLPAIALKPFIKNIFFALNDTKLPMKNDVITAGLNIGLNLLLINSFQQKGLAFATSMANIITVILLLNSLRKKNLINSDPFKVLFKILLATIAMGICIYIPYIRMSHRIYQGSKLQNLLLLMLLAMFGFLVYIIILLILKVKEINWIVSRLKVQARQLMLKLGLFNKKIRSTK